MVGPIPDTLSLFSSPPPLCPPKTFSEMFLTEKILRWVSGSPGATQMKNSLSFCRTSLLPPNHLTPSPTFCILLLILFFWLCWVFIAVHRLSVVAASGSYSSLRCAGFSLRWLLLLQSTGSRRTGSVVVAHGLSYSTACGIFPDQGSNPCPLHWQADS